MRVVVVGSGNVAEALAISIGDCLTAELVQVYGRNLVRVGEICSCLREMPSEQGRCCLAAADIYLLAVSDGAVEMVSGGLDFAKGSVVAHTAACVDMSLINTRNGIIKAVFYPMQTFSKGRRVEFAEIPIFVEAESEQGYLKVEELANMLSRRVVRLGFERRVELHLAAVFSCNFTTALLTATHDVLGRCDLPLTLYEPLIRETIAKVMESGGEPRRCQTGAAVRGDTGTMERHLELLRSEPRLCESDLLIDIYKNISKYIWETSKRI